MGDDEEGKMHRSDLKVLQISVNLISVKKIHVRRHLYFTFFSGSYKLFLFTGHYKSIGEKNYQKKV